MGSFFYQLKKTEMELKAAGLKCSDLTENGEMDNKEKKEYQNVDNLLTDTSTIKTDTPYECLRSILDE